MPGNRKSNNSSKKRPIGSPRGSRATTQRMKRNSISQAQKLTALIGNRAVNRLVNGTAQRRPSDRPIADVQDGNPHILTLRGAQIPPAGGGRPMPLQLNRQLAPAFGRDLSFIRIHRDSDFVTRGATAMTLGADIHFARGRFAPHTDSGRRTVAHEVTHVIQQLSDRVEAPKDAGLAINTDPHLEREADRLSRRARIGIPVAVQGSRSPMRRPVYLVGQHSTTNK